MIHVLASYKVDLWRDLLHESILEDIAALLRQKGLHIVKTAYYAFGSNDGLTYVWFLAESHCIIHTYKEHQTVFLDLFSCKENHNMDVMFELVYQIGRSFGGVVSDRKVIERIPA